MSKAPDHGFFGPLAGMIHAQAKDLPPEAEEILASRRPGGTFVVWKEQRPVAVLVILPAAPLSRDEALEMLYNYLTRAAPPAKRAKKQKPRRRQR